MSLLLNVPPSDQEIVRSKGAQWDAEDNTWYLPAGEFDRLIDIDTWIPQQNPCIILPSPFMIVQAPGACSKCNRTNTCIALASSYFFEKDNNERDELAWREQDFFTVFEQITELSDNLQAYLKSNFPGYKYTWSEDAERHLWLNHCAVCHCKQEDILLFDKEKGIFQPKNRDEAGKLTLQIIHLKYDPIIDADYEMSEHFWLINEFANRIG